MQDEIDLECICINSKPVSNNEELTPVCYRCSSTNPYMHNNGDQCTTCGHPFIRSMLSFEALPLVEFEIDGITEQEAIKIIEQGSLSFTRRDPKQTKSLDANDPFAKLLMNLQSSPNNYTPVKVPAQVLKTFRKEEIYTVSWPSPHMKTKFYRNIYPTTRIAQCKTCNSFFNDDALEFERLKSNNTCPFCRSTL